MKKPEKKKLCSCGFPQSYPIPHEHDRTERENQIIEYYEKFLPSEVEIEKIVNEHCRKITQEDKVMLIYGDVAKAISKRIGKC